MNINQNSKKEELRRSFTVLSAMVKRNIKNQYRNSFLGVLWTVLNPLLNMFVMALVFQKLFQRAMSDVDYPVYLLAGNTVFNLMRMATTNSLPCLVNSMGLLTKTKIPQYVFPVSNVVTATVNSFFSFVALIIVMLIRIPQGVTFHWTTFMVLFPFLPALILFSLGLSFLLCVLYVFFRDIKHIYSVFLTLWMYLTPLFYSINALNLNDGTKLGQLASVAMNVNPMTQFVTYFRDVVLMGTVPDWKTHLIIYGWGLGFAVLGIIIFKINKNKVIIRL